MNIILSAAKLVQLAVLGCAGCLLLQSLFMSTQTSQSFEYEAKNATESLANRYPIFEKHLSLDFTDTTWTFMCLFIQKAGHDPHLLVSEHKGKGIKAHCVSNTTFMDNVKCNIIRRQAFGEREYRQGDRLFQYVCWYQYGGTRSSRDFKKERRSSIHASYPSRVSQQLSTLRSTLSTLPRPGRPCSVDLFCWKPRGLNTAFLNAYTPGGEWQRPNQGQRQGRRTHCNLPRRMKARKRRAPTLKSASSVFRHFLMGAFGVCLWKL
ncbi:hypothetical protein DL89DRAFT_272675 [Linderina pennispora]|uniref:Uncharacterized protein n=1 Tax=Linderina pennispora TaxID=61395 RepID=A0A1Y1VTS4_9FUNG|nr:uncharacterized protein DL89DRAFT_272675 [Linderina pennispora]ORX64134.1 hypothetical protein DL89DRAFT_272675 [Linderina pennispora]